MAKGIIFDIKRFAIHDGPGIRTTVFFKGCPLHCLWCHNPEGIAKGPELMVRSSRCSRCYSCIDACPRGAIRRNSGPIAVKGRAFGSPLARGLYSRASTAEVDPRATPGAPPAVDREKCDLCGDCVKVCMYEALEMAGREVRVADVVQEIERDRIFFEQSGGGVTLSGGDPVSQPDFCRGLLAEMKKRSIHSALDTAGLAAWDILWECAAPADLILYDLKLMDERKHKKFTGVSNVKILDNLKKLAKADKDIAVRIPLMAGVNDDKANLDATINFLSRLETIKKVSLLRYHQGGREKYKNLDQTASFQIFEPPSDKRMEEIRRKFTDKGFHVKIGG